MTYINGGLKVPLLDAIDRFSIIELKRERLRDERDRSAVENEYAFYSRVLDAYRAEGVLVQNDWIAVMKEVNARLWDVEAEIRLAKQNGLSLEQVGQLAVHLRNFNDERTERRNRMAQEIDIDSLRIGDEHASDTALKLPLHEAVDRFTILMLRRERLAKNIPTKKEYAFYDAVLDAYRAEGVKIRDEWIEELKEINGRIWDLEGAIRQNREAEFGLEEMGRRTLELRTLGKERVAFKKKIAKAVRSNFYEVKV